jgi:hypothetical protein
MNDSNSEAQSAQILKSNISHRYQGSNSFFLFIYAFLVFLFLFATETFFSGFHLIDDQTYIILNANYQSVSFLPAGYQAIRDDLFLRFRPLAILYYVAIAKWVYPSFTGIAFVLALQGIFSCYFFFRFARILKCGLLLSFLFPLFILAGNQGVIFWRNCMSETLCMLLISLAFYYLARSLGPGVRYQVSGIRYQKTNRNLDTTLFSTFLFLSTFVKESFIILVPAILFFKIWLEAIASDIKMLNSLKRNLRLIIFFSVLIVTEISIIYYYKAVSNNFIDYVSIDRDTFKPYNLTVSLFRLLISKGYFVAIVPTIFIIILWRKRNILWAEEVKIFFLPLTILFLLIILPQIILYAKSLIFERYLLPGTLGGGLLIIYLQQYISRNGKQLKWLPAYFLPFCILILLLQITLMTRGARIYAKDGYAVKTALKTIIQNTKPTDTILVVAQPKGESEPAISVRTYLTAAIGDFRKNVFVEPVIDSSGDPNKIEQSDVANFLEMTKGIRYNNIINKNSITCILFFEDIRDRFLWRHPEVDTLLYQRFDVGRFNIYFKKKNNKS